MTRTSDRYTELGADAAALRHDLRAELMAFETRLRRTFIAWILIAHSATVIVISLLVAVLALALG